MRRELAAVAALATAGVVGISWPLVLAPHELVVGPSHNDHASIAFTLWWVSERLAAGEWPWGFTDAMQWPDGAALFPADLPESVLLSPLVWAAGPFVALNVLSLGHHVLTAVCAWGWARAEGLTRPGAAVVAVALALAPAMTSATFNGNPDVTPWYWWPLALWALHRHWALAAGLVVVGASCNPYVGVMAALSVGAQLAWARRWRALVGAAAVISLGGLALIGVQTQLLHAGQAAVVKGPRASLVGTGTLLGLADPRPELLRTDPAWAQPTVATSSYLGISLLLAAAWRRGRDPLGWTLVSLGVLLSLGPVLRLAPLHDAGLPGHGPMQVPNTGIPLPMALAERLPGLGQLHLTARFSGMAVLGLALVVGRRLEASGWRAWAVPAVVAVDLLAAGGARALQSAERWRDDSCAALAALAPGPVLDLPGTRHELWLGQATCHGRPVDEGINHPHSPTTDAAMRSARDDGQLADAIAASPHRWLVVHPSLPVDSPVTELASAWQRCGVVGEEDVRIFDLDCLRSEQGQSSAHQSTTSPVPSGGPR